ncbi:MAG: DNA-binding NarL/FixJ family response regulator [Saprospiraceae bacterium]|jgi:DNA-binding NarL/FixJ family response regulator
MTGSIIIADDHPLFRQALRETIAPLFPDASILDIESLEETKIILETTDIELLLLDLKMPDTEGLTGLMMIKGTYPQLPVIVISATEDNATVRACIQAGASAYIFKSASLQDIRDTITAVNAGEVYVPERVNNSISDAEQTELDNIAKVSSLTPAQLRVFYFLCEGQMNKQIAYEMSITEATVKAHITSIYKKLGVRTRTQAVLLASSLREFKSEA